jgi:hypothetical protein
MAAFCRNLGNGDAGGQKTSWEQGLCCRITHFLRYLLPPRAVWMLVPETAATPPERGQGFTGDLRASGEMDAFGNANRRIARTWASAQFD